MAHLRWVTPAALSFVFVSNGCHFGRVEQGRVVKFDRAAGMITLVRDSNYRQPGHPRFDVLPAETVRIPEDPSEAGPDPAPGALLAIDCERRRLVTFDLSSGSFRTFAYTPLEERTHIAPSHASVAGRAFPQIDRARRVIIAYDPAARLWLAFAATDEQLALPAETWRVGDEVRYYYKQPGQALRLMNVTRADLAAGGH